MQISEIAFSQFMRFQGDTKLKLPPVGLILVTGANGAGKSSLIEGVSYALWKKTLRGTSPQRDGEAGSVYVRTGFEMEVLRSWGKRGETVEVSHSQLDKGFKFDTPSKAQDFITETLGSWDTWRRSCAFSSVDDLSFATATDSERKRLLESLLGLSRFDRALELCRRDAKEASTRAALARRDLDRLVATLAESKRNLGALEAVAGNAAPPVDTGTLKQRIGILEDSLTQRERALKDETTARNAANLGVMEYLSKIKRLELEIYAVESNTHCSMCNREWEDLNERQKKLVGLRHDLGVLKDEPHKGPDESRYKAAVTAHADCQRALSELRAQLREAERTAGAYAEAQALVKQAKINIMDMEDQQLLLESNVERADHVAKHLDITDTVLGTKGARAHMLTDALAGLEAVANVWLEKIARVDAPLKLRLSPYTDKKTGGTSDSIALEVEGAGGGRGYKAASGGERRRIDVAIMLALGEIAGRTGTRAGSTMFFDEVFDSLDTAGVAAVVSALDQLAQDRCVVVLSHSPDLIRHISADLHLEVADGKIAIHRR